MLFVNETVLIDETCDKVNTKLEVWRYTLVLKGLGWVTPKNLKCKFRDATHESIVKAKFDDQVIPHKEHFKYLSFLIQKNQNIDDNVTYHIGTNRWNEDLRLDPCVMKIYHQNLKVNSYYDPYYYEWHPH